jgi:hypothetical protein
MVFRLLILGANPKNFPSIYQYREGALKEKKSGDTQKLVRAIVVLIRNTTWRCGKLERLIVNNLHRRRLHFGGSGVPIREMIQSFELTGKKRNEFLDAIRRLERRNIVKILTM